MHALSTRDQMHHQHQQQQQQMQLSQEQAENTMTVLESLNPAQQQQHSMNSASSNNNNEQQAQVMVGMIDPVQRQQQHIVQQQQHLVQQPPHLHQLQPIQQTMEQAMSQGMDDHQRQQQQQQQQLSIEQRPQIISGEGIVADSGGPIVQWLLENYEIAEGESLPRSTVYNHYLAHCRQLQMASVNAASFGKLIRSVFVGLKTRRLGTRGHSKYHYFGVRAKQHVQHELLQHHEGGGGGGGSSSAGCSRADQNDNSNHRTEDGSETDSTGGDRLSQGSPAKRIRRSGCGSSNHQPISTLYGDKTDQHQHQHHHNHNHNHQQQHTIELASNGLYYATNNGIMSGQTTNGYAKGCATVHHQHDGNDNTLNNGSPSQLLLLDSCDLADSRNHLGANWATLVDEHWPQHQENCQLLAGAGSDGQLEWPPMYLELFESKYKSYYKRMVELLSELKFSEVEQLWQQFWRPPQAPAISTTTTEDTAANPQTQSTSTSTDNQRYWATTTATGAAALGAGDSSTNQLPEHDEQRNGHHGRRRCLVDEQFQQQQVELTFHCLYQLTSQPLIAKRISQIDQCLFAAIESFLFPDMLSPIPSLLRQQIEMFAINIGPCIEVAVKDYGPQFVAEKSKSARAFGYALRRYAELNRLSTASRAIWEKRSSLTQLSMDLSRIDLRYIEHQVSLMTNHIKARTADNLTIGNSRHNNNNNNNNRTKEEPSAESAAVRTTNSQRRASDDQSGNTTATKHTSTNNENTPVDENINHHHHHHHLNHNHNHLHHHHQLCAMQPGQLIQNFLHLLEDPYPANSWPDWCRNLFESRVCGLSMDEARSFVLDEWKNYISRIEKELTLRSAPSLSSFHLIKLLFGEYIDYLVDTHLAQARGKTQLAVTS